ncbi:MAG: Gfo/Idh/MocA family oxidoreductase [Defluviitaleaceae bacterium]|nr:Gfo/Idh/MocA family oxidoreductase [Defluviitaleaceae bacterium]
MTPVKVALVGAGGYAALYVRILLDPQMAQTTELVAIVDPYAAASPVYDQIKHLPIYNNLSQFFAHHTADLVIISSPIQLHFEQCMTALENGANVLCEKPLVPTVAELDKLAEKVKETGKTLAVGFQLSYASLIVDLKKRILSGEFGRPISLKAYLSWPRDWEYYGRNAWAGKRKSADGKLINDSVASNATAHYIHNMLFMLGEEMAAAAMLEGLEAECYRANDIETFDTIVFRGKAAGADVFYTATHADTETIHPMLEYTFEKARIEIQMFGGADPGTIHYNDGREEKLTLTTADGDQNKVAFTAQNVRGLYPQLCNHETVRPITTLLDDIFANVPFVPFPQSFVVQDQDKKCTHVNNLREDLLAGHKQSKLPSEMGFAWAKGQ